MLRSGIRTLPGHPVLQQAVLGCTLSGTTPFITSHLLTTQLLLRGDTSLEHNFNRFWEVEEVEQSSMTAQVQSCEQLFISNSVQNDGRFVVIFPTKMYPKQIGSLAFLQSKGCMHRTQDGKTTKPQDTISQIYERE